MVTFLSLWEDMQSQQDSPLQSSSESTPSVQAIRSGLNLRVESGRTFWDEFISLCQGGGMAELLGVSPEQVSMWGVRISQIIDQINRDDENNYPKKVLLPTGDADKSKSFSPF